MPGHLHSLCSAIATFTTSTPQQQQLLLHSNPSSLTDMHFSGQYPDVIWQRGCGQSGRVLGALVTNPEHCSFLAWPAWQWLSCRAKMRACVVLPAAAAAVVLGTSVQAKRLQHQLTDPLTSCLLPG